MGECERAARERRCAAQATTRGTYQPVTRAERVTPALCDECYSGGRRSGRVEGANTQRSTRDSGGMLLRRWLGARIDAAHAHYTAATLHINM